MHAVCGRLTTASYIELREECAQVSKDGEVISSHQNPLPRQLIPYLLTRWLSAYYVAAMTPGTTHTEQMQLPQVASSLSRISANSSSARFFTPRT